MILFARRPARARQEGLSWVLDLLREALLEGCLLSCRLPRPIGLIQLMNPKPGRGAKCLRQAFSEWEERLAAETGSSYVQGKIVENRFNWELLASQMRDSHFHFRPSPGADATRIRAGLFRRRSE